MTIIKKPPSELFRGELRNYPRIINAIHARWGSKKLDDFITSELLRDDGIGEPLPTRVFQEILWCQDTHRDLFPFLYTEKS